MTATVGRIVRRSDYLRVADARRKAVMPGLILQAAPGGAALARFGITCSRKVGNAVARNRAKRRLRVLAASVLGRHADPGHDYVLIGRVTTVDRAFTALDADLSQALRRLGLWRESPVS